MTDPRLVHSFSGYLRAMQMSTTSVFSLVEGKDVDPFFYGQVCNFVCSRHYLTYEVKKAEDLPPKAGGKTALLEFYEYLNKKKCLSSTFKGKKTYVVFFLDKDIDDITRKKLKSSHVIYTRYYDVHNEIFLNGNLVRGVASAASIDETEIKTSFADQKKWCSEASKRWLEWIVLCLISAENNVNCQSNYRVHSKIHCTTTGLIDVTLLENAKRTIASELSISYSNFKKLYTNMYQRVTKLFDSGKQDIVFKGKWYPFLLEEDLQKIIGKNNYMKGGFNNKVTSSVAATLDFSYSWSNYYIKRFESAINRLITK
jgi:hypothetical protein